MGVSIVPHVDRACYPLRGSIAVASVGVGRMLELIVGIALVALLCVPVGLSAAYFVNRPFSFGWWRDDPWPVGVQEEEPDHAWGTLEPEERSLPTQRPDPESVIEELGELARGDRPAVARVRPAIKRAA